MSQCSIAFSLIKMKFSAFTQTKKYSLHLQFPYINHRRYFCFPFSSVFYNGMFFFLANILYVGVVLHLPIKSVACIPADFLVMESLFCTRFKNWRCGNVCVQIRKTTKCWMNHIKTLHTFYTVAFSHTKRTRALL